MAIVKGDNKDNTLNGSASNDQIYGYSGNDTLIGNSGDDQFFGGLGADTMHGGSGNDTFNVDNSADKVVELVDNGYDTVNAGIDWKLSNNVEKLILTGTAVYGTGNSLANFIKGNAADNILDGGVGADTLIGGLGNDLYEVTKGDKIIELTNAGIDKIASAVSWVLGINTENLFLSGSDNINGVGNSLANDIYGNAGNNILDGKSGADTLWGGAGDDTLMVKDFDGFYSVSTGKDAIYGVSGNDTLVITGAHNKIDFLRDKIYGIETIDLTGTGANSLTNVSTLSVINITETDVLTIHGNAGDKVSLNDNSGAWVDGGLVNGQHVYTSGAAKLLIDAAVQVIAAPNLPVYTISDVDTAANVNGFFTAAAQKIVIDFGGVNYRSADIKEIDLTGFGLEDTLVIAQHDGAVNDNKADFGTQRSQYIFETDVTVSYSNSIIDRVSWQAGASKAMLISKDMHYTGNNHGTGTNPSTTYSYPVSTVGSIQLLGLPQGLADSQFVFV